MSCNEAPCVHIDPAVCVPPPTTSNSKQVVVIDNNGCYRVMQDVTDQMAFLVKDSVTGTLRFVSGDTTSSKGIFLGAVTALTAGFRSILGIDSTTGMAKACRPDNAAEFPSIPIVPASSGNIVWQGLKSTILALWGVAGSAYGVFTRSSAGALVVVDGTDGQLLQRVSGNWVASTLVIPASSQPFGYENLIVKTGGYNDGSNTSLVTATASKIVVVDSSFNNYTISNFNKTANLTTSGVNGLDTGSSLSNSWYYLYAIWNGSSADSLLSLSATTPVLPAGYTYKRLISVIRSATPSTIGNFYQVDDQLSWYNTPTLSNRGDVEDGTTIDISNFFDFVPPIAKFWSATLTYDALVYGEDVSVIVLSNAAGYFRTTLLITTPNTGYTRDEFVDIVIIDPSTIVPQWLAAKNHATAGDYSVNIGVTSFRI